MKLKLLTLVIFIATWVSTQPAIAHAQVTSSFPLRNQVITQIPKWVWIEFDGNLLVFGGKNPNQISITDSKSRRVDIGGTVIGGARISTKLMANLKDGRYQIKYRVVSEDGHPVQGSYYFTFKN